MLGDKGYESDRLIEVIENRVAEAVIPPKKNRVKPREYDEFVDQERNKVERCVRLLKQCRRVATRYEKTARNYLGFVLLAATMVWMR